MLDLAGGWQGAQPEIGLQERLEGLEVVLGALVRLHRRGGFPEGLWNLGACFVCFVGGGRANRHLRLPWSLVIPVSQRRLALSLIILFCPECADTDGFDFWMGLMRMQGVCLFTCMHARL